MKTILLKRCTILLLCISTGFCSCVDHAYDLAEIDTDEITIGDAVAGPLGTGIISAEKILDVDNVEEIEVDAQGNYVARYHGDMNIALATVPALEDVPYAMNDTPVTLPWSGSGTFILPSSQSIPVTPTDAAIYPQGTSEVQQIDSILLNTGADQSLLTVEVALSGFELLSDNAHIELNVDFPAGYDLALYDVPAGTTLVNGKLRSSLPLAGMSSCLFTLQASRIVPDLADRIAFKATLLFNAGEQQISITGTPAISVSGTLRNLDYKVIYGLFNNQFSTQGMQVDMAGFDDLFTGDDNVLSFVDPYIKFETENNIGIPLSADLTLDALNRNNGNTASTQIDGVEIKAPAEFPQVRTNKIWIGADENQKEQGYEFLRNDDLAALLKIAPTQLDFSGTISPGVQVPMFYPEDASPKVTYDIVVPLAPAADFKATLDQTMYDVFDEDMVEYLFKSGSVEIYGTAENGIPLDLLLDLIITDGSEQPVGITLTKQAVTGCTATGEATSSALSFEIKQADMPKMSNARHILLQFTASGSAQTQGMSLRPGQEIKLDLKFRKTGGITISSND